MVTNIYIFNCDCRLIVGPKGRNQWRWSITSIQGLPSEYTLSEKRRRKKCLLIQKENHVSKRLYVHGYGTFQILVGWRHKDFFDTHFTKIFFTSCKFFFLFTIINVIIVVRMVENMEKITYGCSLSNNISCG